LTALAASKNKRIGIIGTNATIRSKAYTSGIMARCETAKVFAKACPLLVPLVEEGWTTHSVTQTILEDYLTPMLREKMDTLILGCTHYPLLKKAIRKVVGPDVALVDSAESCAKYVRERLENRRLLNPDNKRTGVIQPFVTDEPDRFAEVAKRFLAFPCEPPWKVELTPM
jgi:glutamate racemase